MEVTVVTTEPQPRMHKKLKYRSAARFFGEASESPWFRNLM